MEQDIQVRYDRMKKYETMETFVVRVNNNTRPRRIDEPS